MIRERSGTGSKCLTSFSFCGPIGVAIKNLLPDARGIALERFRAGDVRWHHQIDAGPSNHLLSSQVQCVNCLAPFVDRPGALRDVFSTVLPIKDVVPFAS